MLVKTVLRASGWFVRNGRSEHSATKILQKSHDVLPTKAEVYKSYPSKSVIILFLARK